MEIKQSKPEYSAPPNGVVGNCSNHASSGSRLAGVQLRRSDTLTAELLDQHLATLSNSAVPQVVSSDKHTVKPRFQGRLPFSFNLPDATNFPPDHTKTLAAWCGDRVG
jgi:hypothetical protein